MAEQAKEKWLCDHLPETLDEKFISSYLKNIRFQKHL